MKLSRAILQLAILIHALFATAIPANHAHIPPVIDGYVDTKSIKNREPDLRVHSTDLALQGRGVDSGDITSRQIQTWGTVSVLMSSAIVSALITTAILLILVEVQDDIPVSSNLMLLVLSVLTTTGCLFGIASSEVHSVGGDQHAQ
jgi:hypothetical protein